MSDVSDAVEDIISMLEKKFASSDNVNEKVLKTMMFATTSALLVTNNEECEIAFDNYKSVFSVKPIEK